MKILEGLNTKQLDAVITRSPATLVLAGAGSGKTGVLTRRIAYLIEDRKVSAHNILALTFTRKAAAEMKERLVQLVGEREAKKMWIGTFHGISLRILEQYGSRLGYQKYITVYDEIDQKDIIAAIISELGLKMKPEEVIEEMQKYASDCDRHEIDKEFRLVFSEYRNRLKEYNAVDFTLLLTEVLRLFREFPEVYEHFHEKFKYVFVDEYQDVDRTQYYLHEAIKPENIFVVGDYDQCIYSWRGSDISIVLEFEQQHEFAQVIKLEQSYRCGSSILDAANSLINNNPRAYDKELWTERGEGSIELVGLDDPMTEAEFIAEKIYRMIPYSVFCKDIAILARTHRQHIEIITALKKKEIPFKEIGKETNFWKRQSARMIISLLKVLHNKKNSFHFSRICRHIIFPMSEDEWYLIEARAIRERSSAIDILLDEYKESKFAELMQWYSENPTSSLNEVIEKILAAIPIEEYFLMQKLTTKAMDVLETFVHVKAWQDANQEDTKVGAFLEWLASNEVQSEIDDKDEVKVATIHAVKGLEFPVVFVAGMVEGRLPSGMALKEGTVEEERRLCYVAITRAKERLYLTHYKSRGEFGGTATPSRFLSEMNLLKETTSNV